MHGIPFCTYPTFERADSHVLARKNNWSVGGARPTDTHPHRHQALRAVMVDHLQQLIEMFREPLRQALPPGRWRRRQHTRERTAVDEPLAADGHATDACGAVELRAESGRARRGHCRGAGVRQDGDEHRDAHGTVVDTPPPKKKLHMLAITSELSEMFSATHIF